MIHSIPQPRPIAFYWDMDTYTETQQQYTISLYGQGTGTHTKAVLSELLQFVVVTDNCIKHCSSAL